MMGFAIVIMMGFILLLVAYCIIRFLLTLHRDEFTDPGLRRQHWF